VGNDPIYSSEVNAIASRVVQVYTDTGWNSTSGESSVELDAVSASNINGANYVKIKFTGTSSVDITSGIAKAEIKAQIKETGDSYADIISYKFVRSESSAAIEPADPLVFEYTLIATLTAGMKTNGFQVKLFGDATPPASGTISLVNIQTVEELA
jgi:hypothetical protein